MSESKRRRVDELNAFFKGTRPGDCYIIQSVDYEGCALVLDIHFPTKQLAKQFKKRLQKQENGNNRTFQIVQLRQVDSMEHEFVKLWFEESEIKSNE